MATPMMEKSVASRAVPTLKWLVTPRPACRSMTPTSSTSTTPVTHPTSLVKRVLFILEKIHARVKQ